MAQFLIAYNKTNGNEGLYSNNPNDRGKETWKGISRVMFPHWGGWNIIDGHKIKSNFPLSLNEDSDLEELVQEFYTVNFWDSIRGNEIIKQEQADSIYDTCVNMGIKTGIKLTQRTLEIVETGIMNNETLNKLNS